MAYENDGVTILEEELLEPYTHLLQVTGKRFRNRIMSAFNYWLQVPEDKVESSLEVVTMVHHGSLLVDDIQDDSVVRRGMPAAHCVYGLPLTLNTCLQVFAMAMKKSLQLEPSLLGAKIYAEQFFFAVYGQGIDIYWRDNFICPTESEYRLMLKQKTGAMINFGVKLMQMFSEDKQDYNEFALLLGIYFQMRDDYCNLNQQEALDDWPGAEDVHAKTDNNFCEDITEGKFSLPIIHAMTTPEGPKVMSILRQRTRDVELKKYCLSLLEKSGSFQYTRDALSECDRKARAELARLGGNPLMEEVLDGLLSWKNDKY